LNSLEGLKQIFIEKKRMQQAIKEGRDPSELIHVNIQEIEMNSMDAFVDFLKGLFRLDKDTRWTPLMAKEHPFISRETYTTPFEPTRETERTSTNEENDSISENSTSSKDSKEYKVGSCPSKIMYP
jgi:hypothetical protein